MDSEMLIFRLLILEQQTSRFTVTDTVDVYSTLTTQKCRRRRFERNSVWFCCDSSRLDQFRLPGQNFAFGMADAQPLLRYFDMEEFVVEHYRLNRDLPLSLEVGTVYVPRQNERITAETLRIVQFIIGKN